LAKAGKLVEESASLPFDEAMRQVRVKLSKAA
jgi:hypothetical protein